jgi:hypothetical protein
MGKMNNPYKKSIEIPKRIKFQGCMPKGWIILRRVLNRVIGCQLDSSDSRETLMDMFVKLWVT